MNAVIISNILSTALRYNTLVQKKGSERKNKNDKYKNNCRGKKSQFEINVFMRLNQVLNQV